ncbi:Serine--tRNA ligase, mitochondrial [Knufia obscura]|uniref:serine--tRNA ligase n=2 Tax=Knufia TaxID=430999 RepID=A0AAN8INI2_9EURO|nr:Serine--tRNA ligase, mitochondrial [Knufia obscura]KAK5954202.1 Serine--tRNA ligase, mitochondrial [Knufia fluminis]
MLSCSRRGVALSRQLTRNASSDAQVSHNARPATAPKQFPDLKSIRNNPELYSQNAVLRNYTRHKHSPQSIAALSQRISDINKDLVQPRRELKALEKKFGAARASKKDEEASVIYPAIQGLRKQVDDASLEQESASEEAANLALALPNLTSSQTPTNGVPKVLQYINYDPNSPPQPKAGADHSAIGQELGILDFSSASTTTGWGFYYFLDEAVQLEQALTQYASSVALRHGWKLVTPPSLVYSHIADSCGFQPRDANDEQQIWQIAQAERDIGKPKRSLAATAEIPLAALYADKAIHEDKLPLKMIGTSRCYRAEAGARGVDTKGLYRVHEFTKTEMFAWTNAPTGDDLTEEALTEHSTKVFDEMVSIQTEILSSLGLPCRVLEMPSNDLGASAFRKIDIEAFFPSRLSRDEGWGELTSVSICTDYQSRRLNTRIQDRAGSRTRFPHTINGTAMAVPRVMACILENGWQPEEGCVVIPGVLRPFMGGAEKIGPK